MASWTPFGLMFICPRNRVNSISHLRLFMVLPPVRIDSTCPVQPGIEYGSASQCEAGYRRNHLAVRLGCVLQTALMEVLP